MNKNVSIPAGGIVIISTIEKTFGLFSYLFDGIVPKSPDFIPAVKLHCYNRLAHTVSVNKILETYPAETFELLGFRKVPSKRSLYRTLERIGEHISIILYRLQCFLEEHNLIDEKQIIDFSSVVIHGKKMEMAAFGYSRDHRPDKLQINFGIATGINGIPTAITIQKGNVQDKKMMTHMINVVSRVLPKNSILIFDCGGNTHANKKQIRKLGYHYLTLMPKKVSIYKKYIHLFNAKLAEGKVRKFVLNERQYWCLKYKKEKDKFLYIYFCKELLKDQIRKKEKAFENAKERGDKILRRRRPERIPCSKGWIELEPHIQETICELSNPYITGIEGYFILESSVDADPEKILKLYKERDRAEKFIRALKEGLEIRPVRHWEKSAVIGIIFICFLTNLIINLIHFLRKNEGASKVKNVKLLKKFLINLTLTIVYEENCVVRRILSNVTEVIESFLGDFIYKICGKKFKFV